LRGGRAIRAVLLAALLTQPVLRAATTPEAAETPPDPGGAVARAPRSAPARQTRPPVKPTEPRPWATASPPGGAVTVVARDREMVVRRPDGAEARLGPGRPLAITFAPGGGRLATAGPGPLVRTWDDPGGLPPSTSLAAARA